MSLALTIILVLWYAKLCQRDVPAQRSLTSGPHTQFSHPHDQHIDFLSWMVSVRVARTWCDAGQRAVFASPVVVLPRLLAR